jgi:hypothetical protein
MMFNDTLKVSLNTITLALYEENWNIVESVVKHHNPNPLKQTEILLKVSLNIITQTSETNWKCLTTLSTIVQVV